MEFLTTREKILELLLRTEEPLTARQIMKILNIRSEKEVYDHLYHLAMSGKRKGFKVIVFSPKCEDCGYVFDTFKRPSRCPKCKSTRITPPMFLIRKWYS